jgi:predicted RNA methylase
MLFTADSFEDIEGKTVLDLGVGCGMLSIGSIMLGAGANIGIDIDTEALEQTRSNLDDVGAECKLIQGNVQELLAKNDEEILHLIADTVVMNPPFGTKTKGADMDFLRFAARVAKKAIYTLHKTSTRDHVLRVGESLGLKGRVIAELEYDLPNTYKFHKKKNFAIQVDFIRFQVPENQSESSTSIGLR